MLQAAWLSALWRQAGEASDFVAVDVREGAPVCWLVSRRPWAEGMMRQRALTYPPGRMLHFLQSQRLPVVVLSCGRPADALMDGLLRAREQGKLPAVELALAGERRSTPVEPSPTRESARRATVTIEAARTVVARGVELPLDIPIDLTGAPEELRILSLRVESPGAPGLPGQAWCRLSGPGRGVLTVDVEACPGGDRWDVRYRSGQVTWIDAPPTRRRDFDRLAVIFDRTTPSERCWSEARRLAMDVAVLQADGFDAAPAAGTLAQEELNAELRGALGEALAIELGSRAVQIEGWWFADTAGDGIAEPEGYELAASNCGDLGTRSASEAKQLFEAATYAPGLDLFDPVELALEAAAGKLEGDSGAVLIVGSSPPGAPADGQGPIGRLANALGFPTSCRRGAGGWDAVLATCRARGLRVIYLFLEHELADPAERGPHERYRAVARQVRAAIEHCLPVVTARATADGVHAGVREAIEQLRAGSWRASGVQILR